MKALDQLADYLYDGLAYEVEGLRMTEAYPKDRKKTVAKELGKFTDNDNHRASVQLIEKNFQPIVVVKPRRKKLK